MTFWFLFQGQIDKAFYQTEITDFHAKRFGEENIRGFYVSVDVVQGLVNVEQAFDYLLSNLESFFFVLSAFYEILVFYSFR